MTIRRTYSDHRNRREADPGSELVELISKYGLGDVIPVSMSGGNFDTGRIVVPNADTLVTGLPTTVTALILSNQLTTQQTITVSDNAGGVWLNAIKLTPNEFKVFQFHGALWAGIRWNAVTLNAIVGQIIGSQ